MELRQLRYFVAVAEQGNISQAANRTPLLEVPGRLAVSRRHRLARHSNVTPHEVAAEPVIGFWQRDYPEYWEAITHWHWNHRQRPRVAGESAGTANLMAVLANW